MGKKVYAKQSKTGRLYVLDLDAKGTDVFLARKDISLYNPEDAEARIAALKRKLEKLNEAPAKPIDAKIIDDAKSIAELEAEIEKTEQKKLNEALEAQGIEIDQDQLSAEEIERREREKIINEDPDIKRIEAMGTKQEVIDYMAEEFGKTVEKDANKKLDEYKTQATLLRIDRLFESAE